MRKWYKLHNDERELMESYAEGEFCILMKEYRKIRRNYYVFGFIPLGKEISESDMLKLENISDKMTRFHGMYSSQHPKRVDVNTRVLEARFEIDKMLEK